MRKNQLLLRLRNERETWEHTMNFVGTTRVGIGGVSGAWAARDVLAHLVSAERGHQRLIANVAAGGPGSPPDLNVDAYNRHQVAALAERSPADLLADLRAARADSPAPPCEAGLHMPEPGRQEAVLPHRVSMLFRSCTRPGQERFGHDTSDEGNR